MPKISDTEILERAKAKHSAKYTYGAFVRKPPATKRWLTVICPEHGEFVQQVAAHLAGAGCKKCAMQVNTEQGRHTLASVAAAAVEFGFTYRYIKLAYGEGRYPLVTYECAEHGEVTQNLYNHLVGKGCPGCKTARLRHTLASATEAARVVHGDRYEYQALEYRKATQGSAKAWLTILCKAHGEFKQSLLDHVSGKAICASCSYEARGVANRLADSVIAERAKAVADKHVFVRVERKAKEDFRVVSNCNTHGEFSQRGYSRLYRGNGCDLCTTKVSKGNVEISQYFTELGLAFQMEFPLPETRMALDIYIPEANLAVEYHGIYWHSEEYRGKLYHLNKHKASLAAGIRTIHIFDDEWANKRSIVERALRNAVGKSVDDKLSARKCEVVKVSTAEARTFLDQTHIQGYAAATAYYGLKSEEQLVAVAGFAMKERGRSGKKSATHAELVRYSTSASVRGGLSRVLAAAQRELGFTVCTTFSDIRFFEGGAYKATGFSEISRLPPDYFYCKSGKRIHKSALQKTRVKKLADKGLALFDPTLTEAQLATLNNYSRVWDCGKIVWQKTWT